MYTRPRMSSNTSAMDEHLANMRALRAIVGPEPKEQQLVDLLRRYPSVNQAANAFFDGSAKGGRDAVNNTVDGTPVATPVVPPPQSDSPSLVSVVAPPGVTEGSEIQVQTHAGMMKVVVPRGVESGTQFLVRLPMQVPLPVAQPVQNVAAAGSSSASYPHGMSYPGHQQQPNVIYQQQQPPQVVVVQSSPYVYGYGGYGYDPFLGGMLGFAGGMLIADAMFY